MQLSKRLQAVAELVTPGSRVADIGCDHAYTSIYLIKSHISPHVIAMDVNQGPLNRANENIMKYDCTGHIETRRSDGIEKLGIGEVDTILIAGMGGALTIQILTDHMDILKSVQELVLQPQSEIFKVRQMLQDQGFVTIHENMVEEDGKYYVMLKAVPKNRIQDIQEYLLTKEEHFYYGRILLEQKHPVLEKLLLWDLNLCEGILQSLQGEQTDNAQTRFKEIEERIFLIHSGLSYYNQRDGVCYHT